MAFEISLVRKINADIEFVFDWWTDLSSDDSSLVKPLKERQIISRTPTLIVLRDEEEMYFRRMTFDVKVTLERPFRWISQYDGRDAKATSEYQLKSLEEGSTLLTYHSSIQPNGRLIRTFSPIIKYFVRRVFASEMTVFNRTLEADYKKSKHVE